ncbi:MAG: phosphate ABC transporter substrate-binding protein [Ignavibacteriaceae bacterium]|nr:phosphate ABC transporter substrate-binding protein [Ignavibacteriaceae bacterium]
MKKSLFFCILILIFAGCSGVNKNEVLINIKGSESLKLVVQILADEFMSHHSENIILVEGGGSETGINSLINGNCDIAMASRPLLPEESKKISTRTGRVGVSTLIARDDILVYVHPSNPLSNLSKETLIDIFSGEKIYWREGEFEGKKIRIIIRPNSGTYSYFKRFVLVNKDFGEQADVAETDGILRNMIANDKYSIGLSGGEFTQNLKSLNINGIPPLDENKMPNPDYPLGRNLYFYTIQSPTGLTKRFIDFILSEEGQNILESHGYFALWK